MKEYNYNSLWEFLKATPKNMWSVILIWGMCIAGIVVCIQEKNDFDNNKVFGGAIVFLLLIMVIGWYRVYDLYQKNRKRL